MLNKDNCSDSSYCKIINGKCALNLIDKQQHLYLKKMVNEIILGGILSDEILGLNKTFVPSFIGDIYKFTQRKGQILISNITDKLVDFNSLKKKEIINNKVEYLITLTEQMVLIQIPVNTLSIYNAIAVYLTYDNHLNIIFIPS